MARRVLYLAWAPFFSGAERALLLTLGSLDPSRYIPHVLAGTEGEFAAQARARGIPCEVVDLRPFDARHPVSSAGSIAAVFRAAARYGASLIHANDVPSFQPGGFVARLLGIPSLTHVRFPDGDKGYGWFLRPGFSRALFVSRALMADALAEAPQVFQGRSSVLHDCVEPQPTWSAAEIARCRRELDLPDTKTIVAIAGQIADVKGIWDFIDAARILAAESSEPFFVVLGDDVRTGGQTRRLMEERVTALGLSARFKFLGFRRDAPRIVQAFDIIAVPSHVEPLGNATLEAMAAGRPVVGSRVGGIPEMLVDGVTGSLTPSKDPGALARSIAALVHDRNRRSVMGRAARQRATGSFGSDVHGHCLQDHYDRLCAPALAPARAGSELA